MKAMYIWVLLPPRPHSSSGLSLVWTEGKAQWGSSHVTSLSGLVTWLPLLHECISSTTGMSLHRYSSKVKDVQVATIAYIFIPWWGYKSSTVNVRLRPTQRTCGKRGAELHSAVAAVQCSLISRPHLRFLPLYSNELVSFERKSYILKCCILYD